MDQMPLDAETLGPRGKAFEKFAGARMKGQEKAIRRLAKAVDHAESPLRDPSKPIYSVFVVGGAASGKKHLARLLAEFWFGDPNGFLRIPCSDFSQMNFSQDALVSSDYLYQFHQGAHRKSFQRYHVLMAERKAAQEQLEALQEARKSIRVKKKLEEFDVTIAAHEKLLTESTTEVDTLQKELQPVFDSLRSILVLDHIECAKPDIQEQLYDLLEHGERVFYGSEAVTRVSLRNTIIFITCSDMVSSPNQNESHSAKKKEVGFTAKSDGDSLENKKVRLETTEQLKEYLSAKFLSRITRIEFLRPYKPDVCREILRLFLGELHRRLSRLFPLTIKVDDKVLDFIVKEGTDHPEQGVRLLRHKFDKYLTWPLENLHSKGLLQEKDTLRASLADAPNKEAKQTVVFHKE